jgi:hypothetical protein
MASNGWGRSIGGVSALTSPQAASFLVLLALCGFLIAAMSVGIPRLARLLLRYRFEVIRDDCVDAILDGRLRRQPPVERFLEATETAATLAEWYTIPRGWVIWRARKGPEIQHPPEVASAPSFYELPPVEQEIMHELEQRVIAAVRSALMWSSPLGWAVAPLFWFASRFDPNSKLAQTEDALPDIARGVMYGSPQGHRAVAYRMSRSRHGLADR